MKLLEPKYVAKLLDMELVSAEELCNGKIGFTRKELKKLSVY